MRVWFLGRLDQVNFLIDAQLARADDVDSGARGLAAKLDHLIGREFGEL